MVDGGQNAIWLPLYFARNSLPPTENQKTSFVLFRRSKTTRLLTLELNNRARCAADVRSFCWRERILASERGSHTRGLLCVDKKQDLLGYNVGTHRSCTKGEAKGETKRFPLCFPRSHQKLPAVGKSTPECAEIEGLDQTVACQLYAPTPLPLQGWVRRPIPTGGWPKIS